MSKDTNSDWPDPSEWAKQIHSRLENLGEEYLSAPWAIADDPEEFSGLNFKQAKAAEIVLAIHAALLELPIFEKSKGCAALHDVAGAFRDVVMGGAPRLFAPARPGQPGGDGIDRNYVKVFVVLAVRFLVEAHGLSNPDARFKVAKIFADAGAVGRKGSALSASTVRDWCDKAHALATNPDEARIYREVEERLLAFQRDGDWPGTLDSALKWTESIARDPLLSSKYG